MGRGIWNLFSSIFVVILSTLSFLSSISFDTATESSRESENLEIEKYTPTSHPQDFQQIAEKNKRVAEVSVGEKGFNKIESNDLIEFPPLFIAIDESLSLDRVFTDGTNKCDTSSSRYKIPLFLLKLFNKWYDRDLIEQDFRTTLAYLADDIVTYESAISNVDIHNYWGLENKITEEEYFSKMLYEQLFEEISKQSTPEGNMQLVLFTDGELSDIGDRYRELSVLEKGEAYELMSELASLLTELSTWNVSTHVFLLCPDKLDHAQRTWWAGIGSLENVYIYGLDNINLVDKVRSLIANLLLGNPEYFDNEWNGWGLIDSRKNEKIEIYGIPYNTQSLSWNVYSVDKLLGDEVNPSADLDGVKFTSGDLLWPLDNCENHRLEIDIDDEEEGLYFYWWNADPVELEIDLDSTNPLVINNSNIGNSDIFRYAVTISDKKQREMKWGKLGRCFYGRITIEDFQSTFEIADLNTELQYLVLEQEIHLSLDNFAPENQSEFLLELVDKISEVPLESQKQLLAIRYHPVLQKIDLEYLDNFTSQIILRFDYLSSSYFPQEWKYTRDHVPRITFWNHNGELYNHDCPIKGNKEGFESGKHYNDAIDIPNPEGDEISIEISTDYPDKNVKMFGECLKFRLYWSDWANLGDHWDEPQDILFELEWDCKDAKCIVEHISYVEMTAED